MIGLRSLFDLPFDEVYYKLIVTNDACNTIILNMKVKEIKIKIYQLKNILIS